MKNSSPKWKRHPGKNYAFFLPKKISKTNGKKINKKKLREVYTLWKKAFSATSPIHTDRVLISPDIYELTDCVVFDSNRFLGLQIFTAEKFCWQWNGQFFFVRFSLLFRFHFSIRPFFSACACLEFPNPFLIQLGNDLYEFEIRFSWAKCLFNVHSIEC